MDRDERRYILGSRKAIASDSRARLAPCTIVAGVGDRRRRWRDELGRNVGKRVRGEAAALAVRRRGPRRCGDVRGDVVPLVLLL